MGSSTTSTLTDLAPYISTVLIPLLAAIFSLIGSLGGGFVVWKLTDRAEKHRRLYGPLRFHLQMMKLLVENKEEVLEDVKEWKSVEMQISLMEKYMNPLTIRWIEHCKKINELLTENYGLIKAKDFTLIADFLDGYLKREITEHGKNFMALRENRTDKLLIAIRNLQAHLL